VAHDARNADEVVGGPNKRALSRRYARSVSLHCSPERTCRTGRSACFAGLSVWLTPGITRASTRFVRRCGTSLAPALAAASGRVGRTGPAVAGPGPHDRGNGRACGSARRFPPPGGSKLGSRSRSVRMLPLALFACNIANLEKGGCLTAGKEMRTLQKAY
jgi:hypothetical protein